MAKKRTPPKARPAKKKTDLLPKGYAELLGWIKERIRSAQLRASLAVNREMVVLYWQIGREILTRQEREGWGTKVIDRLAVDLRRSFPNMTGLSSRNLKYMRAFGAAWPDEAIVQAALAQITWYHNIALLEKLRIESQRLCSTLTGRSSVAGAGTSWSTGSRAISTSGRARRAPTSPKAYHRLTPIWPGRC